MSEILARSTTQYVNGQARLKTAHKSEASQLDQGTLDQTIQRARKALLADQREDGHWCYELEADCTIPAEYIMMMHYLGDIDVELEQKIGAYLRKRQLDDGGWPLYYGGSVDISCAVKCYYALKLLGDSPDAPHMQKARACILKHGGAAKANVFTLIALAIFKQVPWRATPFIPAEVILLPKWFPFHIDRVSYWSRTVMIPLFVLCTLKAEAKNPRNIDIRELFITPPEDEKHYFPIRSGLNRAFLILDKIGRVCEKVVPQRVRARALKRAEKWIIERLNGEHGCGAIFPAMVNAYEALLLLGYSKDHPYCVNAKKALEALLIIHKDDAYCQPCISPIWDTALACLALQETERAHTEPVERGLDWLKALQLVDVPGDWQIKAPKVRGGGWAFQYRNDHYPDLDDSAVVAWALHQSQQIDRYHASIELAADWLSALQSKKGGFASFDKDNTHYYLNEIPFADHGALLDPPTSDVSARCLILFARLNRSKDKTTIANCIEFLCEEQEADGSWFGRWGTNYIYGTWSVLMAFEALGTDPQEPYIRKAVDFLKSKQRSDGGWGESNDDYLDPKYFEAPSTGFQTAWALLGLICAGEVESETVEKGITYLIKYQQENGYWDDCWFTSPGFPKVFYLKYHGYTKYFPLWALAKYRNALGKQK